MKNNLGRMPDFLIIGAAKSGTTSLYSYLCNHPQIFMCTPKEPHFFSHRDKYRRGESWYRDLFADSKDYQLCGEASTTYSCWPTWGNVAKLINKSIPKVKLIYIMRHPVDRTYSHYNYDMIRTNKNLSFENALNSDSRFIDPSMYMIQIKRYLKYFFHESLLFLFLDDFSKEPVETMNKVWLFLKVDQMEHKEKPIIANIGSEHYIRMQTTKRLRKIPGLSMVANTLPKSLRDNIFTVLKSSLIGKHLTQKNKVPPMNPDTRQRLLKVFEKPNMELTAFINRDLSAWNY